MIFRNALLRELVAMAVATFVVLLAIVITMLLVRLLGQAASGAITTSGVVALKGFATLNYLPVLFSLTLFISVLMTLTRSYRDSEMVVWFSCGMSLTQWIRPVLTFAVPVVAIIALLSLVLSPWAVTNSEELRRQMDSRDDVSAVSPGVFRESRQAQRVYFVEEVSGSENLVANVFVSSVQHGKQGVMVAARGFLEIAETGDRFLVLLNGRRYEGEPGSADYKIYEFQRYAMRVDALEGRADRQGAVHRGAGARSDLGQPGRAVVARRAADERPDPDTARDPAILRQPARRPVDEPGAGFAHLHGLQQPAVDYPGADRPVPR